MQNKSGRQQLTSSLVQCRLLLLKGASPNYFVRRRLTKREKIRFCDFRFYPHNSFVPDETFVRRSSESFRLGSPSETETNLERQLTKPRRNDFSSRFSIPAVAMFAMVTMAAVDVATSPTGTAYQNLQFIKFRSIFSITFCHMLVPKTRF